MASYAKSIALIIGNDNYTNVTSLKKARSDATGYQNLFALQGFDVALRHDLNGRDMIFELSTFFDRIQPGDTVAFVFSGHGWSDGSDNFLVPTDMRLGGSETLLARESFALRNGVNGIIDEITKRGAGLTLVVIDACRDNPFVAQEGTRSVGLARGLVSLQAPTGTFVAFSAGAGQTALDRLSNADSEPYSVFTRHFLRELAKPQDLQAAFKRTQRLVNEDAERIGHPQRPAYYDEVIGSACLSAQCHEATKAETDIGTNLGPAVAPQDTVQIRDLQAEAAQAWGAFQNSNSVDALRRFAEQYQGTAYASLAQERISNLTKLIAIQPMPQARGPRPSWCANAGTATELSICNDDLLSQYDVQMGEVYKKLRKNLRGSARNELISRQRQWLKYRNACGSHVSCLRDAYLSRLAKMGY